jgi:hypothetical protein
MQLIATIPTRHQFKVNQSLDPIIGQISSKLFTSLEIGFFVYSRGVPLRSPWGGEGLT